MAAAIEAEFTADRQDKYQFHSAILLLLGSVKTEENNGVTQIMTNAPVDETPRYTIEQARKILMDHGHRPQEMSDDVFDKKIRDACVDVGIHLMPSKPGPKPKKT